MGKKIILQNAEPNEYRCLFIEDECLKYESESYGGQDVLKVLGDYFQDKLTAEAFINLCNHYGISCKREVWWE